MLTVLLSGGHIYILGEAYAFGVIWSFALKSLSVLVLRFKDPRPARVARAAEPEDRIGRTADRTGRHHPGAVLGGHRQPVHQGSGHDRGRESSRCVVYVAFVLSERATARRKAADHALDQFQLLPAPDVGLAEVAARPGGVLVPVRDPNTLAHLKWVLNRTEHRQAGHRRHDRAAAAGPDTGFRDFESERVFRDYEQGLFTRVVSVAEREGRPVKLLVVPSSSVADAIAQAAVSLQSSDIVVGESATFTGAADGAQARRRPGTGSRRASRCGRASSPTS